MIEAIERGARGHPAAHRQLQNAAAWRRPASPSAPFTAAAARRRAGQGRRATSSRPRFDEAVNNADKAERDAGAQRRRAASWWPSWGRSIPDRGEGDRRLLREGARSASCAGRSWRRACARTAAASTTSARSGARSALLPRTHGSALFTRGQTQVLSIVTLGSPGEEQRLDGLGREETKRYIHHYNFPSVQRRRDAPIARPRPARDRPWRAGRARAAAGDPRARRVPLHHPRRLRGAQLQRLDLDGLDLRQHARADGRRCADQGAGRRRGDGPDHRRAARPPSSYAILTDIQGIEDAHGRHGLQGRRHRGRRHRAADGHQDQGPHDRDAGAGDGAGQRGPHVHHGQDARDAGRAARPSSRPTRRASSRSRSTRRRSARSSAQAARRSAASRTRPAPRSTSTTTAPSISPAVTAEGMNARDGRRARADRRGRGRQDLHGHRPSPGGLRRLRRDPAGQRGPGPHRRNWPTTTSTGRRMSSRWAMRSL